MGIYSFDLIKTYENDALHKPEKLQTWEFKESEIMLFNAAEMN